MFETYPDVVTVVDLCRMLQIGKNTAYTLLNRGSIRSVRIGRKYLIPKTEVIGFLGSMCYNGNQVIDDRLHLVMKGDAAQ